MDIMSKVASLCEEHQIRFANIEYHVNQKKALAEKHGLIQEGA